MGGAGWCGGQRGRAPCAGPGGEAARSPTPLRAGWGGRPAERSCSAAIARPCSSGGAADQLRVPVLDPGPARQDPSAAVPKLRPQDPVAVAPLSSSSLAGAVAETLTTKQRSTGPRASGFARGRHPEAPRVAGGHAGALGSSGDVESGWGGCSPASASTPAAPARSVRAAAGRAQQETPHPGLALRGQAPSRLLRPPGTCAHSQGVPEGKGTPRGHRSGQREGSSALAGNLCAQPERAGWEQASLAVGGRSRARWNEPQRAPPSHRSSHRRAGRGTGRGRRKSRRDAAQSLRFID